MQPITVFESHFEAAQVMLKVYRLFESEIDPAGEHSFVPKLREMMDCETGEPLVLLLNDLFLGAVRERADLAPSFSKVSGISAVMLMLGVEEPWRRISDRAGATQAGLQGQIKTLVKRGNDIVHRGDRLVGKTEGPPEPVDYAWTYSHLNAVESVAHTCNALARENIEALEIEAGVAR